MIEIAASILLMIWAIGLFAGLTFGGAIHLFLLAGVILGLSHRHAASRSRSRAQVSPAGMLAIVTRRSRGDLD